MEHNTMFEQQAAWQQERLGKITASEIHKLMKPGKKKGELFGATALSYIDEKISEIITGQPAKDLTGMNALEWGNAHEYEAIQVFERLKGLDVDYYGGAVPKFVPFNSYSGASPDGEITTHVIEVKCPYNSGIHTRNLIASKSGIGNEWMKANRDEYFFQMQFQMLCLKKDKAYFVSYDPRPVDELHQLAVIEVIADAEVQTEMTERINKAGEIVRSALSLLSSPSVLIAHHDPEVTATIIQ